MNVLRILPLLVWVVACYPPTGAAPGPVSPAATRAAVERWPDVSADQLEQGRQLFLQKCNQCHGYPDTSQIGVDHWPSILRKMARKADLDEAQHQLVLHFVQAESAASASTSGS